MLNNNSGTEDNITLIGSSLYAEAGVLPICMWLLMSMWEESHKWDAGFYIYTPVAQQLNPWRYKVQVSYTEYPYPFIPLHLQWIRTFPTNEPLV